MAEKACIKRPQKEYRALCKEPVSHVVARPSPNDILEWHYVLEGSDGIPFAGEHGDGDGNKYASVNLNKSYGYQSHQQHNQSRGYGTNRRRGGGGYGQGGMLVLSRPRSSQNSVPKLSVPPPLNLPSLRKEHERVDSSGLGLHSGGAIAGSGTRPSSSGMGWGKLASTTTVADIANHTVEGATRASNRLNMSFVSQVGVTEPMEPAFHHVEKVATLRGEDFPSLKASLPAASVSGQKQKEGMNQNQKPSAGEEFPKELRGVSAMGSSLVDMRPQNHSGRSRLGNEGSGSPSNSDGLLSFEQVRKKDYFSGPLPLVRSAAHSDWADDERDTSRGIEAAKNSNYILSSSREKGWNNTRGREAPYQHGGRQPWNNNIDSSSNRGTFNREWDNRPVFKSDKPHMENPSMKDFGDSGFDVHDPFPVLGVAKKKKEALKQIEFHDPVRELFEAELELVQKMQEEERRRNIEEQERVIELAREQDERQRRIEEKAREDVLRNKQESLEAARRAEELRKSKEEEKHRLLMEEERRMQAAKQKLLELEERISKREAEAVKGCSSSSTISEDKFFKQKESADVVDWEDSERMVERITTSSTLDLPIRYFENSTTSQFSSDSSFGFPNRQKPTWRKEDIESGSNSRFTPQNMENVPHSPEEELFGINGYPSAPSYFKPGFPDHSVDQSWRTLGDGRAHARNYGMESESRENFGDQYGDPGWRQNQGRAHHGPYPTYPEKVYQNSDGDDCYPFGRRRYSVRQPRVYPPLQESRQKTSFRRGGGEGEHPGSSTSVGGINYTHTSRSGSTVLASYVGDLQDHHELPRSGIDEHRRFDSKLTRRCDSQSSLSVTSPPDSPVQLSDDDLDKSADSSVLATSRKGDNVGLLDKKGGSIIFSDSEKDSLMIAPGTVSCWDNEDWTLESNEQLHDQEKYDEDKDGYQEEDKVNGIDENIDLAQKLGEMYLGDKESNLVLGFNEGVEVEIPSDDFGKCQQNLEATIPLPHHTVESVDDERPIKTGCGEQAAQPIEVSDSLSMHNASRNFQGANAMMLNLLTSSLPTAIPPVSTTSEPMEEAVKFQFGLFSGPSLIPSLFPTIQIGSIQMPLPLHPQFGSSLTHVPQLQSPTIQFDQLEYTPPISQELLPPPHDTVDQVNRLSTYALNQNPGSFDFGQGNSASLADRNAANSVSNPRCSVLNRPTNVSDGGTLKNANTSPARVSIESAVAPQKQPELSGRNSGSHSSGTSEVSRVNSGGSRRYRRQNLEFRVRELNWPSSEENRNGNGRAQIFTKNRGRKYVVSNKSQKQALDCSVASSNAMQKTVSGGSLENRVKKDAPSQGGIVCIVEQHGTEALSDDDDFIEVKSKRKMLNDRREKREKEIKEKSQASKASQRPRLTVQNSTPAARSNRSTPAIRVTNNKLFNPAHNRRQLAPIGTRSPKTDSHGDEKSGSNKSTQASSSVAVVSRNDPASDSVFSNKKVLDNSHTSMGTWDNQLTYQPVMALTQSQLDEAMKPISLVSCVSDENGANRISKPTPTPTSVVPENNTFSSSTSPINSLLAEGKIQFGAVSSSTVIPFCGGHAENGSSLYFEKDNKHGNPSTTGMEIRESEPGASTVVVAAITNDETGGNALGTDSVLPAETKIYGATKSDDGAASGTVGGQPSLSKAEESLIVSLPADLSVDNPITLWPPFLSPHNSNQIVTHFPPGTPHYPFFEVNPMLRGPIFAFGPHHDTGANQSQSQKGPGTVSGLPTTWQQQSHSGVDSFYAPPPAGFTGPFLSPPGAIPGVQGPAHMFVYNHFAPVGQFGGLSFMGTTYIPSGKQPDWKHNPVVSSSSMGGDGDVNNPDVASMQCNNVPASLQHLPMPMFDPSLFQSSSQEMLARGAQWPYMPFSGPPTMQTQKQQEAADVSNLPSPPNRYPNNIQPSTAADTMVDSSNAYSSTTCAPPPKPTTTLSDPNNNNTQNPTGLGFKSPPPQQEQQSSQEKKNTPYENLGGSSNQHNHNRRLGGFHGRNQQAMARERGFQNNRKVKQIYVAKQSRNSNACASSTTTTTSPSI